MRAFEPADTETVLAINAENEPAVGPLDHAKLDFFAEQAPFFVVAEARDFSGVDESDPASFDTTALGFLILLDETVTGYPSNNFAWFVERYQSFAYIDRVAVTASAQGRGLGSAMYRAVEAWAVGFGKEWMLAEVNTKPDNPHSHHFHQKTGFEECGRGNPYGDDQEVAYYAMKL